MAEFCRATPPSARLTIRALVAEAGGDNPEIAKLALYASPFVEFTEQGVAMPSVFRCRRRAALRDG
jgi:hypothetical protein